jgi:hypothetical protein
MHFGLHAKYPLLLSDFNETWIFSKDFQKMLITNFMKIRPVIADMFHAEGQTEGQTDMKKLIVTFRNFADAPKLLLG